MANFSLFARMGLNTKAFTQGLDAAQKRTKGFSGILGGLGAQLTALASVGGLVLASRRAIQLGRDMQQLSNRTNTTVEGFMALRAAAMDSGSSQQTLERALRNVNARTVEATRGNKAYAEALEELGLNVERFAGLSVEQRFEAIAKAVANAEDEHRALAIASRILGERAGPELLETLRQVGTDGLDPLVAKMKAAGRLMDRDTVKSLEALDENLASLRERFTIFVAVLIARVTPAILKLIDTINENGKAIGRVVRFLASFAAGLFIVRRAVLAYAVAAKAFTAAKVAMAAATGLATKGLVLFKIALAKTGIGLVAIGLGYLATAMFGFGKSAKEAAGEAENFGDKSKDGLGDVAQAFEDMQAAAESANNAASAGLERVGENADSATKSVKEMVSEFFRARKQAIDAENEAFLRQKELEALRARAAGQDELADQLDEQVKKTREALRLQERYNISLQEGAGIIKGIDKQNDAKAVRGAARTPEGLAAAAGVIGRGVGATFQPMDDGNFQRFINGQEAGVFSDEELRQALRDRIADDESQKLLGDIVDALRGRFVNE
jgi:hypothetical protein